MEDNADSWSVLLAAKWINDEIRSQVFNDVAQKMSEILSTEENASIARIGIFPVHDHIISLFSKYKSGTLLNNEKVNGFFIHEAYVFRSESE